MIDRWSAARHAREAPLATAIVRMARLTWLLVFLIAAGHLWVQYQLQRQLLADVLDLTMATSEARMNERTSAMKTELLAAIGELETRVELLGEAIKTNTNGAAALLPTSRVAREEQRGGR